MGGESSELVQGLYTAGMFHTLEKYITAGNSRALSADTIDYQQARLMFSTIYDY